MQLWEEVLEAVNYENESALPPCLKEITKSHASYASITQMIHFPITKVFKVQSPALFAKFMLKKEQYCLPRTRELFHDTEISNVSSIIMSNLDWRRVVRSKYGVGVSFATTAEYANRHSNGFNTEKAMIIADVLVEYAETYSGNFPSGIKDTTISADGNVIVKYCDDEFFPKYVVHYTGQHKVDRYSENTSLFEDVYYDDYDDYDNYDDYDDYDDYDNYDNYDNYDHDNED